MFTGIVKAKGRIESMTPIGGDVRLTVRSDGLPWPDYEVGESIAVNGVGEPDAVIHAGGSTIIGADGDILSEPVFNREAVVSAEIDMTLAQTQALTLDTDGHYSRPDIFELHVDTAPRHGVVFSSVDTKQV